MKRFIASVLGVLMAAPTAFLAPAAAIADGVATTGPWVWTDLSSQLTHRTNRPVWAVAYAGGSWFYTDGQDLWNGGQVYRYDGSTQINITTDVRNAGLARVDDIVTDGETTLFLQDVVRLDNQLSVVAYRYGQYTNITSQVRSGLRSDEGVSSITGRAGTWMVVTTKARLLRLTNSGSATEISLPSNTSGNIEGDNSTLRYNVNHGSAVNGVGRVPLAIVPVNNGNWLLMADTWNNNPRFFRYDGTNFTDVTTLFPNGMTRVYKLTSNSDLAFIYSDAGFWLTNGVSRADISGLSGGDDIRTAWNGKSWLILVNKNLYRFQNTLSTQTAQNYGATRDLFLQGAGDNNGRLLLAGAQSDMWNSNPSYPLTAKLVMVTEGVSAPQVQGVTTHGDRVYTTPYGPRVTVNGNPADFRIGNGRDFNYQVTASDADGVSRIDLYVNDALIRTCLSETTCGYRTTYWTNGANSRSVKFWSRATDRYGNVTETASRPDYLTVDTSSNASAGNNGQVQGINTDPAPNTSKKNPAVWDWTEPNRSSLSGSEGTDYRMGAWDEDGLARIEIFVNGSIRRTCELGVAYGNRECSFWIQANDWNSNTDVFVNARATDRYGNVSWTNGKTIRIQNTNAQTSGNVWVSSNKSRYNYGDRLTFTGQADNSHSVDRMDMYVNDVKVETCEDTRTCNAYTGPFFTDIALRVRAVLVTTNGNSITSPEIVITRN